jgi:hypothetical protein
MKKILLMVSAVALFVSVHAETPVPVAQTESPQLAPAQAQAPVQTAPATSATENLANYVGTNDFYLALIHEGVKAA